MKQAVLVCLALLSIVSIVQAWPIRQTDISLVGNQLFKLTDFQANLKRGATLTVTHTKDIQVCLQEAYPVPQDIAWWNQSCTRYYKFEGQGSNSEPSSMATRLRNVHYNLAIGLWDRDGTGLANKKDSVSLTLGTADDSCPDDNVYDDNKLLCIPMADRNVSINTPINHTFLADNERAYFAFDVPPRANRIIIAAVDGDKALPIFQLRRKASPGLEDGFHDGLSGSRAVFDFPRPGRYYFVARATAAGIGHFQVSTTVCGNNTMVNGTMGPDCNMPYNSQLVANMKMEAVENQFTFWQIQCSQQNPMSVMVRSFDGTFFPRIYASRDQLPSLADGNSDLNNCHGTSCSGVNTLNLTCTSDSIEYWYVGVTSAPGVNGTPYGIWFTPVCAPGCDAHGECSYSDPNVGECVCDPQYLGPDCAVESDVNARFIVLCVIAGLLVTSALLGLIVQKVQLWRRSKASYSQL